MVPALFKGKDKARRGTHLALLFPVCTLVLSSQAMAQARSGGDLRALVEAVERSHFEAARAALKTLAEAAPNDEKALRAVIKTVRHHEDWRLRENAAFRLGKMEPPSQKALKPLIRGLDDKNPRVRMKCVQALGAFGAEAREAVPALLRCLEDERCALWVVITLGKIGPDAAVAGPALAKRLSSEDVDMRTHAAVALGRVQPKGPEGLAALIAMLEEEDRGTRQAAARTLGMLGSAAAPAVPALIRALDQPNDLSQSSRYDVNDLGSIEPVAHEAARALGRIGPAAHCAIPILAHPRGCWKKAGIQALADIGPEGIPPLIALLRRDRHETNKQVVAALATVGRASIPALFEEVRALSEELGDPPVVRGQTDQDAESWNRMEHVSARIQEALETIGEPVVPPLLESLDDPCPWVRKIAFSALRDIQPEDRRWYQRCQRHFAGPDPNMRACAAAALCGIEPKGPRLLWRALRCDPSEEVRVAAAGALRGLSNDQTVLALVRALGDESIRVRSAAAHSLCKMDPPPTAAVGALTARLTDPDRDVRMWSPLALGHIGAPAAEAIPALLEMLKDDARNHDAFCSVHKALAGIGVASVPGLLEVLRDPDASSGARYNTLMALRRMGPPAHEAVPLLEELSQAGGDKAVLAKEALAAIRDEAQKGSQ